MRHSNVQSPPRTIMEAYKSLPEGTLAELIDGIIYMSPAPSLPHQDISGELFMQLRLYVKTNQLGKVYACPCDVYLDEVSNAVQPDILFISSDNKNVSLLSSGVHGTPDLIIEILSPGSKSRDRQVKKELYQSFGVKEYWIIEPHSKETVGYVLKDGVYHQLAAEYGKLRSMILNEVFVF